MSIFQVLYNDQLFDTVRDFITKYHSGSVKKIKIPVPSADVLKQATLERRGAPIFKEPLPGPAMVDPNGRRFSVKGRRVNYMKWQFELGLMSLIGPSVFDVRYDDKRIAYEISLQEAAAFYSGYSPKITASQFFDSAVGLGRCTFELIKGLDCPENAVYFDSVHLFDTADAKPLQNSACVFEMNNGIPIRRKRENDNVNGPLKFAGGLQDSVLVVRQVVTPSNYDYIVDYVFYQSGVIEVRTAASGYLQTTYYYSGKESDFGFKNYFGPIAGPVHDHMIVYKVDLDIGGQSNTYQTLDIVTKNLSCEWEPGTYRIKKTIHQNIKRNEKDAVLKYNFDQPKYLIISNSGSKNKYGNPRGYRIQSTYMVKQKYPDDYYVTKAAAWSKYQLAITRHKEDERFATSIHNQYAFPDQVLDFDAYIDDNENIVNQDLVAWVTVGGLHIPNTEDIPNTMTTGNLYSFLLKPFGYFDEDPTMASRESIFVKKDGKDYKTSTYDTPQVASCQIPDRKINFPTQV